MLSIKNLNVSVEEKKVLKNFNLDINDGSIHVIMGPNGIGKSTLSRVIMGDNNYKVCNTTELNNLKNEKKNKVYSWWEKIADKLFWIIVAIIFAAVFKYFNFVPPKL